LTLLEEGLIGMLKAVGADVEDLEDVCLLRFIALNFGTINTEALTACVKTAITDECELGDGAIKNMTMTLEPAPNSPMGVFATLKFADDELTASIVQAASEDIVDSASSSYNFSKAGRAARASQAVLKIKSPVKNSTAAEINRRDMEEKLQEKKANASDSDFKTSLSAMLTRMFDATAGKDDFEAAFLAKVKQDQPDVYDGMDIDGDGGPTISDLFARHNSDREKLLAAMITLLQSFGIAPEDLSA